MKKQIFFICCLLFFCFKINSQNKALNSFETFPQEKIYANVNSNLFLTGEHILYKIYCLNDKKNNLSSLSKIGYVEVIDSNNNSLFKQKIALEKGQGFGDIFLNSTIKTGTYKFVAYTQWMLNSQTFFEKTIYIVNPFSDKLKVSDSISKNNFTLTTLSNSNLLKPLTNKKTYAKREEVIVSLTNNKNINVSVSARKIDDFTIPNKNSTLLFLKDFKSSKTKSKNLYLPELRGELYQGKISSATNKNVHNKKIGISYIGENKITKISTTSQSGEFYFNINKNASAKNVLLEVLDKNTKDYKIELQNNNNLEKTFTNFPELFETEKLRNYIKQKSKYLQIENAYNTVKQNTLRPAKENSYVFSENKNNVLYNLDDFTRFKTVKEVTVEILQDVWLTEKNNEYSFHLRDVNLVANNNLETLLIVDGFIVKNHTDFVFFDALKIKNILLVKEKYVFGTNIYQGIIKIETINNSYKPVMNSRNSFTLLKPEKHKDYFHPNYKKNINSRVPDYRTQLYWNPNLKNSSNEFSFYTSDVPGKYQIIIEGFTNSGEAIYEELFFEVK